MLGEGDVERVRQLLERNRAGLLAESTRRRLSTGLPAEFVVEPPDPAAFFAAARGHVVPPPPPSNPETAPRSNGRQGDGAAAPGHRLVYTVEELHALRVTNRDCGADATQALRSAGILRTRAPPTRARSSQAKKSERAEDDAFVANVLDSLRSSDVLLSGADASAQFEQLLLPDAVLRGLKQCGFARPSPIQWTAIPVGRTGVDLIAQAKSGTGKTCVFCVICIETALHATAAGTDKARPSCLILAPTREIAVQIATVGSSLAEFTEPAVKFGAFIGGTSVAQDSERLRGAECVDVAVGTPGRIAGLIRDGILDASRVKGLVLDEADSLLGGNLQDVVVGIMGGLPMRKQVCAFSATYPASLVRALRRVMREPAVVSLCGDGEGGEEDTGGVDKVVLEGIEQVKVVVDGEETGVAAKLGHLTELLSTRTFAQCIVFCNDKGAGKKIQGAVRRAGLTVAYMSGDEPQSSRNAAMQGLRNNSVRVLVASDLVSRGVDLASCSLVINLDLPRDPATYTHRVGRAGRFGTRGTAITVVCGRDSGETRSLRDVERQMGFGLAELSVSVAARSTKRERASKRKTEDVQLDESARAPEPSPVAEPPARPASPPVSEAVAPAHTSFYGQFEVDGYWRGYESGEKAGYEAAMRVIWGIYGDANHASEDS